MSKKEKLFDQLGIDFHCVECRGFPFLTFLLRCTICFDFHDSFEEHLGQGTVEGCVMDFKYGKLITD